MMHVASKVTGNRHQTKKKILLPKNIREELINNNNNKIIILFNDYKASRCIKLSPYSS